ncbi:hypothetical protein BQ8794_220080 [Mesorhizobium prunaredense]|uniref:Uncharacterized protein n=1 Tax=Mesorhizobium prunaredense TaxID=1631249 RepID=A0A1R3V6H0_9HYPH|nr:hypothetical protein BQ8794_220080 [Mesorhizobium prunaredense]
MTRSSAKASWTYIGCSIHSVPSLSNTAMRSGSGTKSGEPSLLTLSTNSTIAAFGAVSFQEGNGSDWAIAKDGTRNANAPTVVPMTQSDFNRSNIFVLCVFLPAPNCSTGGS